MGRLTAFVNDITMNLVEDDGFLEPRQLDMEYSGCELLLMKALLGNPGLIDGPLPHLLRCAGCMRDLPRLEGEKGLVYFGTGQYRPEAGHYARGCFERPRWVGPITNAGSDQEKIAT